MKLFQIEDWMTMPMGELHFNFLHGTAKAGFEVIRVPGGWIVTYERLDAEANYKLIRSNSVFVPEPDQLEKRYKPDL